MAGLLGEGDEICGGDFAKDLTRAFADAVRAATRLSEWEGDFSRGPCVMPIPDPDNNGFQAAFVWKQDNNGTTFVVSPVALPWLWEYESREHVADLRAVAT
jgi:hypothetical protein